MFCCLFAFGARLILRVAEFMSSLDRRWRCSSLALPVSLLWGLVGVGDCVAKEEMLRSLADRRLPRGWGTVGATD